jgi:hypothetical protein
MVCLALPFSLQKKANHLRCMVIRTAAVIHRPGAESHVSRYGLPCPSLSCPSAPPKKANHLRCMVIRTDAVIHRPDAEGYVSRYGLPCPSSVLPIPGPKDKPYEIHGYPHRGGDTPPRCRRLCLSVWSALPCPTHLCTHMLKSLEGIPYEMHGYPHRGGDTPPRCRRLCLSVWSALPFLQ